LLNVSQSVIRIKQMKTESMMAQYEETFNLIILVDSIDTRYVKL